MWEYPVYCTLPFFGSKIAEMPYFNVILKVAFEIFHTNQEYIKYIYTNHPSNTRSASFKNFCNQDFSSF